MAEEKKALNEEELKDVSGGIVASLNGGGNLGGETVKMCGICGKSPVMILKNGIGVCSNQACWKKAEQISKKGNLA